MHCASCEKIITLDLASIDVTARVDVKNGKAEVTYNPSTISEQKIIDTITSSGYHASFSS